MARAKPKPRASLYDRDFFAWTQEQAALLRQGAARQQDTHLDLEHLAEEIDSLGKRDRRALTTNIARVIEHLLKLQYARSHEPRAGWETSVDVHRTKALKILADSPGLRRELPNLLGESYHDGRRWAARSLRSAVDSKAFAESCPYTLEQILDHDWWP